MDERKSSRLKYGSATFSSNAKSGDIIARLNSFCYCLSTSCPNAKENKYSATSQWRDALHKFDGQIITCASGRGTLLVDISLPESIDQQ